MSTKGINMNTLKEEYEKIGLLGHYMSLYNYQNEKSLQKEFELKRYPTSEKQAHSVKIAEFIVVYEKIKSGKQ